MEATMNLTDTPKNMSPESHRQQQCALLNIPAELRLHIFEYLFSSFLPISLFVSNKVHVWGQGLPDDLASYLLLCREINKELNDVIWNRLRFSIRAENGSRLSLMRCLGNTKSNALLNKVRHVEIMFPLASPAATPPGIRLFATMRPCLDVIKHNTALRSVTFNCNTSLWLSGCSEEGVRRFALSWRNVLLNRAAEGVKVRLSNTKSKHGMICVELFREAGWTGLIS
jgi:hypothetical protein